VRRRLVLDNREILNALIVIDETDKSSIVHSIKSGIEGLKRNMCHQIFQLGAYLIAAKAHAVWSMDGSGAHDFAEWLESEVGIKKSTGYDAIAVTLKLFPVIGKHPELDGIQATRLVRLLPYTKGKTEDEIIDLLYLAKTATCKGLEYSLRKNPPDECSHEGEPWYYEKCKHCNFVMSVKKVEL
jgi:hypothetical protein